MEQKIRSYCDINNANKRGSVMSVRAGKYNTKLHKYEDVLLPDESDDRLCSC